MKLDTTLLAMLPPFMAIVIELVSPVSRQALLTDAEAVARDELGYRNAQQTAVASVMAPFAYGAVNVATLTPIVISVVTASIALVYELPSPYPFWLAIGILLLALVFLLWLSKKIKETNFFNIAATSRIGAKPLAWIMRYLGFALNGALIVICAVVYYCKTT